MNVNGGVGATLKSVTFLLCRGAATEPPPLFNISALVASLLDALAAMLVRQETK